MSVPALPAVTRLAPRALRYAATPALRWSEACQHASRRNALVASTLLAQRRAERDDVEEFLAARGRVEDAPAPPLRAAHG